MVKFKAVCSFLSFAIVGSARGLHSPRLPSARRRKIVSSLVPAIPKRRDDEYDVLSPILPLQLHPRFIAREFLLGARYMMRMAPLLTALSVACNYTSRYAVATWCPILIDTSTESVRSNPAYILENTFKQLAFALAKGSGLDSKVDLNDVYVYISHTEVFKIFVRPIIEEIAYRGICQHFAAFGIILCLWLHSSLCRLGVISGLFLPALLSTATINSLVNMFGHSSSRCISIHVLSLCNNILTPALVMPAFLAIFLAHFFAWTGQVEQDYKNLQDVEVIWEERPGISNVLKRQMKKNISDNGMGGYMNYDKWIRNVESSVSQFARWTGSIAPFRHAGDGPFLSRKLIERITSSLLIESRLVVNRQNLWSAIGARVVWNILVCFAAYSVEYQSRSDIFEVCSDSIHRFFR